MTHNPIITVHILMTKNSDLTLTFFDDETVDTIGRHHTLVPHIYYRTHEEAQTALDNYVAPCCKTPFHR
jgi:hypothetical protein